MSTILKRMDVSSLVSFLSSIVCTKIKIVWLRFYWSRKWIYTSSLQEIINWENIYNIFPILLFLGIYIYNSGIKRLEMSDSINIFLNFWMSYYWRRMEGGMTGNEGKAVDVTSAWTRSLVKTEAVISGHDEGRWRSALLRDT